MGLGKTFLGDTNKDTNLVVFEGLGEMDDIYGAIIERNARETLPFVSLVNSNRYLETHVDVLQARCESLERQYLVRGQ